MHSKNYPDTDKVFRAITKEAFERVGGFNEKAGYTDDYSLSEKLGVMAVAAPEAIFYHKNPDTLKEVFIQSKWMSKRQYKLGIIGTIFALLRVSLPFSIIIGSWKSRLNFFPQEFMNLNFLVFKIVSDFGQFIGILEYMFGGKVSK
jgi:GT2 family glycosyltransferase